MTQKDPLIIIKYLVLFQVMISKRETSKNCTSGYQYPEKSPVNDKIAYRVIFLYEGQDNKRVSDVLMASDFQNVNNW